MELRVMKRASWPSQAYLPLLILLLCVPFAGLFAQPKNASAPEGEEKSTVEVTLSTEPRLRAKVYHGKQLLGVTPLRLTLPANSGSLDVVVKATGHIPVNTRIYTFLDERITVSMTRYGEERSLFGYRKRLAPPGEEE